MKKLTFASLLLLFSNLDMSFSQANDIFINPYWYFYSNNHLDATSSGMGTAGVASVGSLSSVYINPASMDIEGKYQVGIQYTYKTNQEWLPQLGSSDLYLKQNLFSGSIGLGYRFNKHFQAGLMYSNPTSMAFNIGEIIMTNEFGQEIGRYDADDRYVNHSFSIPLVYSVEKLSLGLTVSYNMHRRKFNYDTDGTIGKFDKFNIQGGIIVQPVNELSIGVSFKPESNGEVEYSSDRFPNIQSDNAVLPMEFTAGLEYKLPNNMLRFAGDYSYVNGSVLDGQKDQHQVRFGLEYLVNRNWKVRTGFFTSPDPRDLSTNYLNPQDSYDQIFLTLGATLKLKNTSISIAVMDSHISSGVLKYTFINAGLTFNY